MPERVFAQSRLKDGVFKVEDHDLRAFKGGEFEAEVSWHRCDQPHALVMYSALDPSPPSDMHRRVDMILNLPLQLISFRFAAEVQSLLMLAHAHAHGVATPIPKRPGESPKLGLLPTLLATRGLSGY